MVITDSNLVQSAKKWTLDYLEQNMGNADYTVFASRNHKFKYYDEKKIANRNSNTETNRGIAFTPPTKKLDMKLTEFIKRLREWKKGEERFAQILIFENSILLFINFQTLFATRTE